MSDEELVKRLLDFDKVTVGDARDAALRIKALTEQLEAARADAKEAEAYAEELEKEIELNEQEACMVEDDLIKADKEIDDLKAKLAKVVSIAKRITSLEDTTEELAECGCARCKAHLKLRATLAEIEGTDAP
jgi:chromosome segregation ATPase